MITDLVSSVVMDALLVGTETACVEGDASTRGTALAARLGTTYPDAVRRYFATVSRADLARDLRMLVTLLRQESTIFAHASVLQGNGLIDAVMDWGTEALPTIQHVTDRQTAFGVFAGRLQDSPRSTQLFRILTREMQELLEVLRRTRPTLLQCATAPTEAMQRRMVARTGRVVDVRVDRSLLGGVRLFEDGFLTDDSWRGRLHRLLSVMVA